jgi:signal transduction histidine kinase
MFIEQNYVYQSVLCLRQKLSVPIQFIRVIGEFMSLTFHKNKRTQPVPLRNFMQLATPIFGLVVLIGIAGFALLSDIARDQDNAFVRSSSSFISHSVETLVETHSDVTAEYSIWDDAVANITLQQNDEWMKTNYVVLGTSSIAVFRPSLGIRFLFMNPAFEEARVALQQRIPDLASNTDLYFDPVHDKKGSTDIRRRLLVIGGKLASVHVQPIQPESGSPLMPAFKKADKDFLVAVAFIGDKDIAKIGDAFGLTGAKLHLGLIPSPKDKAWVIYPIKDYSGKVVGWVEWKNSAPGTTAFEKRISPILLGLFLAGVLAVVISYQIANANLNLLAKARAAEEASRTKSTFLANISHELRTPLNTIIGYSEMIEEEGQESGQCQTVQDARKVTNSAQHLLALINDLLDHSKIEAGKMDLNPAWTSIEPLLKSTCDAVQSQINKNKNQLVFTLGANIGDAWIDAMRLKQCLLNLMSNSAKFTENGTISLDVSRGYNEDGHLLLFKVTDTGLGMDPETIERLFSPFVQADEKVASKYGGTGLGLVITKALINAMGGNLTVISQLGEGSTFTIAIPLAEKDQIEKFASPLSLAA